MTRRLNSKALRYSMSALSRIAFTGVALSQGGCALMGHDTASVRVHKLEESDSQTILAAKQYRAYALMAADVYATRGVRTTEEAPAKATVRTDLSDCSQADSRDLEPDLHLLGWERAPDIERYLPPIKWAIYSPDLAMEVWRNTSSAQPFNEYSIVFRGTTQSGSVFADFRSVLRLPAIPVIRDLFVQAQPNVEYIVRQIHRYQRRAYQRDLLDGMTRPARRTLITAVGHSLGAQLALRVATQVKGIDQVVGLNPLLDHELLDGPATTTHPNDDPPAAAVSAWRNTPNSIRFLVESGEPLDRLMQCKNLRWPDGRSLACDRVDLAGGAVIKQHAIAPMACKLDLIARWSEAAPVQLVKTGTEQSHD